MLVLYVYPVLLLLLLLLLHAHRPRHSRVQGTRDRRFEADSQKKGTPRPPDPIAIILLIRS